MDGYKEYCKETYLYILSTFPEARISPTVHKVVAHSPELIANNGNHGLKNLSEEGLESVNKVLRNVREKLSRKNSPFDNITDCLNRLWGVSDPVVNLILDTTKPYCKHCKVRGHSTRYCCLNEQCYITLDYEDHMIASLTSTK
jgi:hypothetical protein